MPYGDRNSPCEAAGCAVVWPAMVEGDFRPFYQR